ncbi:hypothetical protein K458DRAFT_387141 [Lentithecium fluviatile CBS 122367]|uniref:Uncharacterized protein n=1 Tax=Lentithecium fluviatile CBS 122367 TaxID=1168545 RepID=A0A6G1J7D8_9PLEO|nr:hypothetical protein K458DRAFT_387141 [Lentithecium fluviatile CBS 122367]
MHDIEHQFAKGWNIMSEELKVKVLQYSLRLRDKDKLYPSQIANRGENPAWKKSLLYRYFHMTPEISRLTPEICYKINTVETKYRHGIFAYPNPKTNIHVRRLSVDLKNKGRHRFWNFFKRLSKGVYGFPNLKLLELHCGNSLSNANHGNWQAALERQDMVFGCKGVIRVGTDDANSDSGLVARNLAVENTLARAIRVNGLREC